MVEPRTEEKKRYELIVPFESDEVGMHEFANEVADEFGVDVVVNEIDHSGVVISGLVHDSTKGQLRDR
jgi:hypothetical protein